MYLLTVSPLCSGIPYEELSYFSKADVSPGDLVEVSVRKREIRALVLSVSSLTDEKQSLKNASFTTKKITRVLIPRFLDPLLWQGCEYAASYHLKSLGTLIYSLLSEKSFDLLSPLVSPEEKKGFEVLLLEQSYENRIQRYKTTIRELFSKKKSLVIFFPTIIDLEHAEEHFLKGIEEYVVVLHGGLSEKAYKSAQLRLQTLSHPVLILSTPSLLPWTRKDLGLVIVEREHSHYYYTYGDTGYDTRHVIEVLAQAGDIPCLYGSHMLSLSLHKRFLAKEAHEIMPLQYRNDTGISVVPMTKEEKTESPYISRPVLRLLREMYRTHTGHYFFYAHRKGMYPTTVCEDCGELFACTLCNRPYVLHMIAGIRTYVCHGCESIVTIDTETTLACPRCQGWRMRTLGIATTGVEKELQNAGIPLFVIDSERTKTKAAVKKVYEEWKASPYGILIGTEMAHNIVSSCDGAVILSLDSLFSLPEYRTDEKVLSLVTEMSEKITQREDGGTRTSFILQTRLPENPVMKQLVASSFREVYTDLLRDRETFLLPPYYTVIKASYENIDEHFREKISKELAPYTVYWFEQGRGITLLFIHIEEKKWSSDEHLRYRIKCIVYDAKPVVNPLHFFVD